MNMLKKTALNNALATALITLTALPTLAAPMTGTFKIKVINGSSMPLSPALVYVTQGHRALTEIGQAPSAGFVKLCQTGNNDDRLKEVKADMHTVNVQNNMGLTMPGQSAEFTVTLNDPSQSIHFEAMYGKTKDSCAVFDVNAKGLLNSANGLIVKGRDEAVSTGAFDEAALPMGAMEICKNAASAVDCLRELALPTTGTAQVRFFKGYVPSVINFLEEKYGSGDVQTLLFSPSGSVRFEVSR